MMKRLTESELNAIERRFDEIERLIDECRDDGSDNDVLENLELECNRLLERLEVSYRLALRDESGLRVVS